MIDERISPRLGMTAAWTMDGVDEGVKMILSEDNTLFRTLIKNLNNYPGMKAAIRSILMEGAMISYHAQQDEITQLQMCGLIRNDGNIIRVENRIFETMLYNYFLTEEEIKGSVRRADLYVS